MAAFGGVELTDLTLRGPRLTLRPWEPRDAPLVYAALSQPGMTRYLTLPEPYLPEMAGEFVVNIGHAGRREGSSIACAVTRTEDGSLVASAELRLPTKDRRHAEIGYWVAPTAHGHGYAAEATDVLCQWGFAHGLTRIELYCDPTNTASAATALRAGFQYEGRVRNGLTIRGELHDDAQFARLASDSGEPTPWSFPKLAAPLTDGTIELRRVRDGDDAGVVEIEDDPVTMAVGFTGKAVDPAAVTARMAQLRLEWLVGGTAQFVLEDVETKRLAGTIQLRKEGPPGLASIGYDIHPAFRGRRYTTRALRLLSSWAFSIGYARLELGAKVDNIASRRSAEGAGFLFGSVLPARLPNPDGSRSDEAFYHLLAPSLRR
jgi:RimJ/RimL family protein N-acetyltransferase